MEADLTNILHVWSDLTGLVVRCLLIFDACSWSYKAKNPILLNLRTFITLNTQMDDIKFSTKANSHVETTPRWSIYTQFITCRGVILTIRTILISHTLRTITRTFHFVIPPPPPKKNVSIFVLFCAFQNGISKPREFLTVCLSISQAKIFLFRPLWSFS